MNNEINPPITSANAAPGKNSSPPDLTPSGGINFHPSIPWLVLIVSLGFTILSWRLAVNSLRQRAEIHFQEVIKDIQIAIENRMLEYEQILQCGVGLFNASTEVSRPEWRLFYTSLQIEKFYPGIQGYGLGLWVQAEDKSRVIEQVRSEGYPDFDIKPPGERSQYCPVFYLEPFNLRNQRAFGYDMWSEPVRREAMSRARDSGKSAMSGKVTLVQETQTDVQAGVLFYMPVYRNGMPVSTVAERRSALHGFVYSPFRMQNLMNGILRYDKISEIGFQLYDGTEITPQSLMYDNEAEVMDLEREIDSKFDFTAQKSLAIAGRTWTIHYSTRAPFDAAIANPWLPNLIAGAGVVFNALLFMVFWQMSRMHKRAQALAEKMTQQLRESQNQFRAVAETANDAIISADNQGRIIYLNHAAIRMFGFTGGDAVGKSLVTIIPDRMHDAHHQGYTRAVTQGRSKLAGKTVELTGKKQDGEEFPVELSISHWHSQNHIYFTAILRDISDRKLAEKQLQQLAVIIESADDAIISKDLNGVILSWNPGAEKMFGYLADEVIGKPILILFPAQIEGEATRFNASIERGEKLNHIESIWRHKQGRLIDVSIAISPIVNKQGEAFGVSLIARDISERKDQQKRLLAQQEELQTVNSALQEKTELLTCQKVELEIAKSAVEDKAHQLTLMSQYKSEFLSNMSHELRTPLNSILLLSQTLAENREGRFNPGQIQRLLAIHTSGMELLELINDILDLAKIESGKMPLNVVDCRFSDIADAVNRTFALTAEKKKLSFRIDMHPKLPPEMNTDDQRLLQILKNLIANALKFTEKGEVVLTIAPATSGWSPAHPDLNQAQSVMAFSVRDTGIGIPADKQELIFDAFQQAESGIARKYGGTGLGLSICLQIVQMLGGELRLNHSEPGMGSTFIFYLPQKLTTAGNISRNLRNSAYYPESKPPSAESLPQSRDLPSSRTLTRKELESHHTAEIIRATQSGMPILIIMEDDEKIIPTISDLARDAGYEPIVAMNVADGLALARQAHPLAITLDINLPDGSG